MVVVYCPVYNEIALSLKDQVHSLGVPLGTVLSLDVKMRGVACYVFAQIVCLTQAELVKITWALVAPQSTWGCFSDFWKFKLVKNVAYADSVVYKSLGSGYTSIRLPALVASYFWPQFKMLVIAD